ncbi:MAG: phosphoserine transaminase [Acidimicrobiales bacterium]
MTNNVPSISIPPDLLPKDGRFGSGPSKVRPEAIAALAARGNDFMGTSHRRPTVKDQVGALRSGLSDLFGLPDDWEVVLGNGGTTVFWDAATFGLIERQSQHLAFGEFSSKFAKAVAATPFLDTPEVIESAVGSHPQAVGQPGIDFYALTHNETSTGVLMSLERPDGTDPQALVGVDATSAAGATAWDPSEVDVYYFAPQKTFASDGGLWIACCSQAAQERIERMSASDRWIPASIDLGIALENSKKNQTYNTPALGTILLATEMVTWINDNGGMSFSEGRSRESSGVVYEWAEKSSHATPFVADETMRSHVVTTIDFDGVDADTLSAVLRANGVVDTESYRKLGRNQLRIAAFPAIDPDDVRALMACLDYLIERLAD